MPPEVREHFLGLIDDVPWGNKSIHAATYINPRQLQYVGSVKKHPRYTTKYKHNESYGTYAFNTIYENTEYTSAGINEQAMYKSSAKACKNDKYIDPEMMDHMKNALIRQLTPGLMNCRVWSLREALLWTSKSTSHGWQFQELYAKEELFMQEWFEPRLEARLEEFCDPDFDGDRFIQEMFTEGLKDEKILKTKRALNKLRVFCGASVFFKIISVMVVGDFNEKYNSIAGQGDSWCGGQPLYGGWDTLARKILKHPNIIEADAVQWDSSMIVPLFINEMRVRFHFFAPEYKTQRTWALLRNVYRNIVFTPFINNVGEIYLQGMGNPSGQNSTIVSNGLGQEQVLEYSWRKTAPSSMQGYESRVANTEAALFGDDNLTSVSDKAITFYNPESIALKVKEIGPAFEFAQPLISRGNHEDPGAALLQRTFLSRGFGRDESGLWLPVPATERLNATLDVVKNNDPSFVLQLITATYMNCWPIKDYREFISSYLLHHYEQWNPVKSGDPEWELAKTTILGDYELCVLYYGFYKTSNFVRESDMSVLRLAEHERRKKRYEGIDEKTIKMIKNY